MTDGNLAALNQYLKNQDILEEEQEYLDEKRTEKAQEIFDTIMTLGFYIDSYYVTANNEKKAVKLRFGDIAGDLNLLELETYESHITLAMKGECNNEQFEEDMLNWIKTYWTKDEDFQ